MTVVEQINDLVSDFETKTQTLSSDKTVLTGNQVKLETLTKTVSDQDTNIKTVDIPAVLASAKTAADAILLAASDAVAAAGGPGAPSMPPVTPAT